MVQNDPKVGHFNKCACHLYTTISPPHLKLIYTFELLTSRRIHTYVTHIYQRSVKIKKDAGK